MPRVPDVLCAGDCGNLLYSSNTSLPPGQSTCRPCRKIRTASKPKKDLGACTVEGCTNRVLCKAVCVKHHRQQSEYVECSDNQCSRKAASRGMCLMHYKRWARANGMNNPPSSGWNEARRNRYHEKRTTTPRRGDQVVLAALIERDGLTCSWCEQPIDLTLTWPHNMYRSIDHVVPVSKGGEHSLENTRLLHFACNSRRGNRAA